MTQPAASDDKKYTPVPFRITKKTLQSLAPVPATAVRLLALLDDADAPLRKIAEVASGDVGIAAAILRMANSPVFGVRGRVGDIDAALRLIGTAQARLLVLTWGIAQAGQKELRLYSLASGEFMRHSELVATLSMAIAREVRMPDSATAYSAGLLHDIGKAIINAVVLQSGPEASHIEPFSDSLLPGAGVLELEQQIVGTDHQAVGLSLAQLWALPPEMNEAISQHHSSQSTSARSLTAIVALANAVAGQVDDSYPEFQRASLNEPTMLPLEQLLDLARTALK